MDSSAPTSPKIFSDERDLELALASACASLGLAGHSTRARFYPYSSLKSTAFLRGNTVSLKASDAFKSASSEVLLGLALYLVAKLFRKRLAPNLAGYVDEYKRFTASKSSHKLHNSIRVLRSREKTLNPLGECFDLNEVVGKVAAEYWSVLEGVTELPAPTWAEGASVRTLGEYDDAFNRISISKALDSRSCPRFVLEYVVFHELLHAKHDVRYSRGRSLRRTVHTGEFKADEQKFARFPEADAWLDRNAGKLSFLRIS